jgi:hypothetical protein
LGWQNKIFLIIKNEKMKKQLLCIALLFVTTITTQAQLGGLLKKAKDKVTEKKATPSTVPNEAVQNSEVVSTTVTSNATTFQMYDQQYGYRSAGLGNSVAYFKKQNKTFSPYEHIRKSDETGTFHFAKDYPELASVMEPLDNNVSIIFSNTPFSNNNNKVTNSFTSKDMIYAKISVANGTIKDALKIGENDDINFGFVLYNDETIQTKEQIIGLAITPAQANSKSITVDILPDVQLYKNGKQGDFWGGAMFAGMHDQYTLSKNGTYKIGFYVKNEKVDDWGKPIWGDNIIYSNYFDYNFRVIDAAAVVKEADLLNDLRISAIKNVITPLPKQWTEKTSTTAMGFTQAQLITMYENSFSTKLDPHTVVKFHASSSNGGWTTQNNDYGIPIYRYSNQWYTIFVKYANGTACFYQGFGLRQQYNGGGTYGKAFIDKTEYHMTECAQMK